MKFSVEYKRTVRVRQYETLTIGWVEEFDKKVDRPFGSFELVKEMVNHLIEQELKGLQDKGD